MSVAVAAASTCPGAHYGPVRLVAVASDRLFPPHRHQELAAGLRSGVTFSTLESQLGHDAYMLEAGKLSEIVRQSLG